MTDTTRLIQEYVKSGSESAFGELVRRYIDLVYSVALRRVGGDAHMAQDVTQIVFCDLARKASRLPADVMLGGWLHRYTGFVASNVWRSERRRHSRERQAVEMNLNDEEADAYWQQLAPMLDEAIDGLEVADRDAVIMRYFEHRDLRAIGVAMGVSEDAAQKRVSRAVDKLREMIGRKGVTMTVTLLVGVLAARSVAAAPTGLAAGISATALVGSGGVAAVILKSLASVKLKIALAAVLVCAVAIPIWLQHRSTGQTREPFSQVVASNTVTTAVVSPSTKSNETTASVTPPVKAIPNGAKQLNLTLLDDTTGSPVPEVPLDFRGWVKGKPVVKKLTGDAAGLCAVGYASNITELEITTRKDGYADTRLLWDVKNGDVIPTNYVLRMVHGTPIGGLVVDADGNPVSGAKVGFNNEAEITGAPDQCPESHSFGWIEVVTDAQGKWTINRIAPEMTKRIYGSAKHPEHLNTTLVFTARDTDAEKRMREGTYVFQLGHAINVRGQVVNTDGEPIAGAKILDGVRDMSDRRETTSSTDGTFMLAGCKPGKNLLTAESDGYAATTMEVDASEESLPFTLTLQRGTILRLSVVNKAGEPIRNANIWLNTMPLSGENTKSHLPTSVQAEFSPKTDKEGKAVWSNAPNADLVFEVAAAGYFRQDEIKVHPDGQEHVITLTPALTISGTVVDAETHEPLPHFRIISGWPEPDFMSGVTNAMWSTIDRFWLNFSGGKFRHQYEEALVGGTENRGYILKFTADGYAPFVSRVISPDEGEAKFDVELSRSRPSDLTVLQPDGQPAIGADVGLVMPSGRLMFKPGGISRENLQVGGSLLETDKNGNVQIPPDETVKRIAFAHESGYAEVLAAEAKNTSTIQLQPWGRIEGDYFVSGKPAIDREISVQKSNYDPEDISLDSFSSFKIKTDAVGHFVFPQVPAGDLEVVKFISLKEVGKNVFTHAPLQKVTVRPGETATVEIGTTGYTVTAKINWAAGEQAPANANFYGSISSDLPMPMPSEEIRKDAMALSQWRRSPEVQAAMKAIQRFPLELTPEGTVQAENVPVGDYVLSAGYSQPFKPGETPPQFYFVGRLKLTVPAYPPTGTLDAGQIDIVKQATSQVGRQ